MLTHLLHPLAQATVDPTNLYETLGWIALQGGAAVVVGAAISYLLANWTWFSNLPSQVKFIVPLVLTVGLSLGAHEILKYPEFIEKVQPYYYVAIMAALSWLASQYTFVNLKSKQIYGALKKKG